MDEGADESLQIVVLSVFSMSGFCQPSVSQPVGPPQCWCEDPLPLPLISSVFVPLMVAHHEALLQWTN